MESLGHRLKQKPPALEPLPRPAAAVDEGKDKDEAAPEPEQEQPQEEFFSESESGSESIEIADLKKRMWKDQMLLMKLEGRSGHDGHRPGQDRARGKEEEEETPEARYRRKAMLRAQDGVLRHMLKMMEACNARGAVIKHLSPRFDQIRKLVWQSKRLQHRMSARDADTWSRVISQEEALSRHAQRSLHIVPLDDDDQELHGPSPRESHAGKRKREAGGGELQLSLPADGHVVTEADRSSIDELMKLYYSCLQGADGGLGGEQGKDVAAGAAWEEGVSPDTVHGGDAPQPHDDMLDDLLGVAHVVDMSDFPDSPIWHWGSGSD
uniref:Ethylene insensitive 3-like DNA-binding domain-containing protein n=1 Tax=Oryza brachyantha TaxID=4533 RepID=J3LYH9_ORYBR